MRSRDPSSSHPQLKVTYKARRCVVLRCAWTAYMMRTHECMIKGQITNRPAQDSKMKWRPREEDSGTCTRSIEYRYEGKRQRARGQWDLVRYGTVVWSSTPQDCIAMRRNEGGLPALHHTINLLLVPLFFDPDTAIIADPANPCMVPTAKSPRPTSSITHQYCSFTITKAKDRWVSFIQHSFRSRSSIPLPSIGL